MCDLICGTATAGAGGVEILVIADLVTLLRGVHEGTICETGDGLPVPIDVVRDLCRQAGAVVTAAVMDETGRVVAIGQHTNPDPEQRDADPSSEPPDSDADPNPNPNPNPDPPDALADIAAAVAAALTDATGDGLTTGRQIRLANRVQRRSLRAMYRTCAHSGCRVPFADCFIHHVIAWEHGGPTDPANLVPLCGRHHHLVHDTGWRLAMDAERTLRWYRPDGTLGTEATHRPLTATHRPRRSDPIRRDESADDDERDLAAPAQADRSATDPTTAPGWQRSRGARGSPPARRLPDSARASRPDRSDQCRLFEAVVG